MAEVEYGGVKLTGSKMLMIIPLVSMLGGGLWAGFEFYKDYTDMKETIQEYVAPDLSGFDKQIAIIQEHQKTVEKHMEFVEEELTMFKLSFKDVRTSVSDTTDYLRDTKHDLKDELVRIEKVVDRVEDDIDKVEIEVRELIDEGEKEQDKLKDDVRNMIDDANNRFNDKVSGLEGYVKRELGNLEDTLNKKLTKALDNPLAN